jgi:hypothetical protein
LSSKIVTFHTFNNMNLPITMVPSEYGKVMMDAFIQTSPCPPGKGGEGLIHRFNVEDSKGRSYIIDVMDEGQTNKVRIQGNIDLSWIDTKVNDVVFKR